MEETMDDIDRRVASLVALMSADVEHRLIQSVLANMSSESKLQLERAIVARVEKSLAASTDKAVDDIVRQWIGQHAAEHTKKSWPPAIKVIEKAVAARIDLLLGTDLVDKAVDEFAKPAIRDAVRGVVNGLIATFRGR